MDGPERRSTRTGAQMPLPPFTTSKFQQDASRKLGMTVKRAMMIAQRLYEGIELGAEGTVGLITYMRTDSVRVSNDAIASARKLIGSAYGKGYLPGAERIQDEAAERAGCSRSDSPEPTLRKPGLDSAASAGR